jgi:multidrug efflux system membrane fusion protein
LTRRFKWLVVFGVVALLAVGIFLGFGSSRTAPFGKTQLPVPVEVAASRLATVPVYIHALGTVTAYRTVTVEPMVTGPLERVNFHEGQYVRKGQLIAQIDPQPYEAALAQAMAKLAQDRATRTSDHLQAQQNAALVKKGFVSKQQWISAWTTYLAAKALVKQDRANILTSRINLDYTNIRAPISGRTGILQVDPGNLVSPGLANGIVTINRLQPIYVQFSLPQQDLPEINQALSRGPLPVLATIASRSGGRVDAPDAGVVTVLDNQINTSTGTLTLRARFPNPRLNLWPGSYVDVDVEVRVLPRAVTVPTVAVQKGPAGDFVYQVKQEKTGQKLASVRIRPVTVDYENGTLAVIGSGLRVGEEVVTEGTSRLKSGTAIRIAARMKPGK